MKFLLFPKSLKNWVPFGMGAALAYWMENQDWFATQSGNLRRVFVKTETVTDPRFVIAQVAASGIIRIAYGGLIMLIGKVLKFKGSNLIKWFGQGMVTASVIDTAIDGVTRYIKAINTPPREGGGGGGEIL